jgi:hypothetical protein
VYGAVCSTVFDAVLVRHDRRHGTGGGADDRVEVRIAERAVEVRVQRDRTDHDLVARLVDRDQTDEPVLASTGWICVTDFQPRRDLPSVND